MHGMELNLYKFLFLDGELELFGTVIGHDTIWQDVLANIAKKHDAD